MALESGRYMETVGWMSTLLSLAYPDNSMIHGVSLQALTSTAKAAPRT